MITLMITATMSGGILTRSTLTSAILTNNFAVFVVFIFRHVKSITATMRCSKAFVGAPSRAAHKILPLASPRRAPPRPPVSVSAQTKYL